MEGCCPEVAAAVVEPPEPPEPPVEFLSAEQSIACEFTLTSTIELPAHLTIVDNALVLAAGYITSIVSQENADAEALAYLTNYYNAAITAGDLTCEEAPPEVANILYYKMDELAIVGGSQVLLDSAGNANMGAGLIPGSAVVPAHISNGVQTSTFAYLTSTGPIAILNLQGATNVTLRFWLYVDHIGFDFGSIAVFSMKDLGGTNFVALDISARATPVNFEGHYTVSSTSASVGSGQMNWRQWRRIIIKMDMTNLLLSLIVDNGAAITTPITAGTWPNENLRLGAFIIGLSGGSFYILDEFGVWPNYLFTPADDTYDWNGGAGRSWPDVPIPP